MKVLKGIISVFLTITVIPTIIVFIVYLSTNSMLSKKNVNKFINEMDVSDFLVDKNGEYNEFGKDVREELIKSGLPEAVIDEFVNSKEITDFVADYAGNIINYVVYDEELKEIKAEDVYRLINDNVDSIVAELRAKKVEGYEELTDEKLSEFKSHVAELSVEIEKSIPDMKKEIEETNAREVIKIIRFVFSRAVYITLVLIILFLVLFIFLLNYQNFNFLIWYGVIFIASSLPFMTISNVVSTINIESDSKAIIDTIMTVINKLSIYSNIFFIIGILCIVIVVISKAIKKQNTPVEAGI